MTRNESRELAMMLVHEHSFQSDLTLDELARNAADARDIQMSEFAAALAQTTLEHLLEIDAAIEKNLKGWQKSRLSRMVLAILRVSVCEILYMGDTPVSVAVNEGVGCAKKYAYDEDVNFVNGILGTIARGSGREEKEPS